MRHSQEALRDAHMFGKVHKGGSADQGDKFRGATFHRVHRTLCRIVRYLGRYVRLSMRKTLPNSPPPPSDHHKTSCRPSWIVFSREELRLKICSTGMVREGLGILFSLFPFNIFLLPLFPSFSSLGFPPGGVWAGYACIRIDPGGHSGYYGFNVKTSGLVFARQGPCPSCTRNLVT